MEDLQPLQARVALVIEEMILADETVTTRAIIRRMPGDFRHPTDITRRPKISECYRAGVERQRLLRTLAEKSSKTSKLALQSTIARLTDEIAGLRRDRDLLLASHRAMLAAIGEMGGWAAWLRFFQNHPDALRRLKVLEPTIENIDPA
jgi:hypothetical protein